jgi:tetratricopeptide (TPR) repeat protein
MSMGAETPQAAVAAGGGGRGSFRRHGPGLALIAIAIILFARTASYPFLFDDTAIVADNRLTRSLANIPEVFASSYWEGTEVGNLGGLYRPVVIAVYAVEHALYGTHPAGYHVVNILLHALATWLAFRLFTRLMSARAAWIGAALFAAHPAHVEAVAGVVGRAEVLSAALVLAALLLHTRARPPLRAAARRARGAPEARRETGAGTAAARRIGAAPWLCAALYLTASLTKESSLAAIGLVALYEWTHRHGGRFGAWRRAIGTDFLTVYLPWIIAAAVALGARYAALGFLAERDPILAIDNPLMTAPAAARFPTAFRIFFEYVRLAVFPLRQSMDYSYNQVPVSTWGQGPVLAGIVFASVAVAGMIALAARRSTLLFAAGWCAVTYALIANMVVLIGTVVAERLLYLPSVGFCMLAGAGLASVRFARPRALAFGLPAVVLLLLGGLAAGRVNDWRSEFDVLRHDVKSAPRSARILSAYGKELYQRGDVPGAVAWFDSALSVAPHYGEPYLWKAFAATAAGRRGEALQLYIKAIHRIPTYVTDYNESGRPLLGFDLGEMERRYRDGVVSLAREDPASAAASFQGALEVAPDPESARQLAALLLRGNREEDALVWAERAVAWDPGSGEGHWILSGALFARGDPAGSLRHAEEAARLGYAVPPDILARLRRGR